MSFINSDSFLVFREEIVFSESKINIKFIIISAICLLIAGLSWFITEKKKKLFSAQSSFTSERFGQIQKKQNEVKRNYSGQLLWFDIDDGEIVYQDNSIQTDADSFTEIKLDNGTQITLGPETLVKFQKEDGQISLNLVDGQVDIQTENSTQKTPEQNMQSLADEMLATKPSLILKNKNKIIKLEKGHSQFSQSKLKPEQFEFKIIQGQAEVNGKLVTATNQDNKPSTLQNDFDKINNYLDSNKLSKTAAHESETTHEVLKSKSQLPLNKFLSQESNHLTEEQQKKIDKLIGENPNENKLQNRVPAAATSSDELKQASPPVEKKDIILGAPKVKNIKIQEAN